MHRHSRVATDARGVFLGVDAAFTDLFGWAGAQLAGRRIGELVHPDDLKRSLQSWAELMQRPGSSAEPIRIRYRHREGQWVSVDVTCHNALDSRGEVLVDLVDARHEELLLELLAARDQLLGRLGEIASVGVFHADLSGRMRYANPTLEKMTGVAGARSLGEQLAAVTEADRPRFAEAIGRVTKGATPTLHVSSHLGASWRVSLSPLLARTGTVSGVAGYVSGVAGYVSVSADDDPAADLQAPACDPLTGALTRSATLQALADLVTHRPGAEGRTASAIPVRTAVRTPVRHEDAPRTACIVVRLGELERIARTHGPGARDEVLRLSGLRIRDAVRSSDLVGRTGPDELTVLCAGMPDVTAALSVAHAILEQVGQTMILSSGVTVTILPGIGVGWAAHAASQPEEVLARSQAASVESAASDPPEPVLAEAPARPAQRGLARDGAN